jgi:PTH1 family peptidyl-tRNA hydrolase
MKIKAYFIVGLGNPGSQYASTYHNVGWLVLDHLIKAATETMTLTQKGKQKNFEFFKFSNDKNLILVKPLTFMNESGKAVNESVKYFQVKLEEILVIHDDSDIELGKLKLSFGRGAAGHHGIESIIKSLKTKDFSRLRIGIRKKENNGRKRKEAGLLAEAYRAKAGEMVLKKINPDDKLILEKLFRGLEI